MADIIPHSFFHEAMQANHDLATPDTIKTLLTSSSYTPDADHDLKEDVTNELSDENGYSTGGATTAPTVADDDANNKATIDIADPSWTASGGAIGPARYGVTYNDTHASDALIYIFDFTEDYTANDGADFTIVIDATNLLFGVAQA